MAVMQAIAVCITALPNFWIWKFHHNVVYLQTN